MSATEPIVVARRPRFLGETMNGAPQGDNLARQRDATRQAFYFRPAAVMARLRAATPAAFRRV